MSENLAGFIMRPPPKVSPEALAMELLSQKMRKTMSPVLRCKMRVAEVVHVKNADGTTSQERVKLSAVYGPEGTENSQWSKWTPSASFEVCINNPKAFNQLANGHEFFVDFTPVIEQKQ